MPTGVSSYEIYASDDGINYQQMTTTDALTTNASISINTSKSHYFFYVKAMSANGLITSTSNIAQIDIESGDAVDFLYIRSVSVLPDNNQIRLSFFLDSTLVVPHYKLNRSLDGLTFENIATLQYTGKGTFSYTDNLPVPASELIYSYVISAPDVCTTNYKSSQPASSIRLEATSLSNDVNNLQWNAYSGWTSTDGFTIYRYAGSTSAIPDNIGASSSVFFTDNSANVSSNGYNLIYNVVATESGTGADGKQAMATSSYSSIKKETLCWIPNAFTPKSFNNSIFKPQISFIRENSYKMRIYNRYGQIIFETTDTSQGWDGKWKDNYVNPSSYIYLIEYIDSEGIKQKKTGTFALID
jgi:gliding motility-associated-like protein